MIHPAMFTSMTMASLWITDFRLKSSSLKVIGTLAHSGRAAGPSLMMVFTCFFASWFRTPWQTLLKLA
jgi:hypothetical protein